MPTTCAQRRARARAASLLDRCDDELRIINESLLNVFSPQNGGRLAQTCRRLSDLLQRATHPLRAPLVELRELRARGVALAANLNDGYRTPLSFAALPSANYLQSRRRFMSSQRVSVA